MADKPILFSGPMVRALIEGAKTQTRRVITKEAAHDALATFGSDFITLPGNRDLLPVNAEPGDRLWVRERFAVSGIGWGKKPSEAMGGRVHFHADPNHGWHSYWGNWRPSIHMPRWASRLTLNVTEVRVQRLQAISEADAIAEGCRPFFDEDTSQIMKGPNGTEHKMAPLRGPADDFQRLWDGLNDGRGYGWEANPWVAAYRFTVARQNIDAAPAAA
ncbi:hypothetical protein PhaeoP23_01796 [Phaeobacter piscinae]|uniref:Phage protein n=1 Tax=Phaeobacter piscinae TaxID=1580596 RepID=A0ABN5DGN4_9RHOB|nr:hypothetical protein [Phaeobacter piscinae]ATG35938.1 hypothetical protein PhaeoP36_01796 [Phaeobacter piscinae]AUQ86459.1 hypothetical protein PhaeoP42_01797 [Phaeobacter piscinae]AUR24342.1 hypothetical protein PhaeoP23_01796 [Phaeobacter piscinae]